MRLATAVILPPRCEDHAFSPTQLFDDYLGNKGTASLRTKHLLQWTGSVALGTFLSIHVGKVGFSWLRRSVSWMSPTAA